ncbi:hypothetical protein, partial [Schnuerera sp.]|uniref:hypothetical protein n=1 Tax=Schnuerera sp. TaxID=2794844 RepID=UPI002D131BFA
GAATLLGIAIILINLGVFTYVATWFWPIYERIMQRSGLIASTLGILLLVLSFYVQYVDNRYNEAKK